MNGRPVDLALSPDGRRLFVKDRAALVILDTSAWKEESRIPVKEGASLVGIEAMANDKVLFTDSVNNIHLFTRQDTAWTQAYTIDCPGPGGKGASFPCGIRMSRKGGFAFVCLSRNNTLGVVDLVAEKLVKEIPVGVAPYAVELSPDGKTAYVSNQGGRFPRAGEKTAPSSGTEVPVDDRGLVKTGTVSVVDLDSAKETDQIEVGLQPSGLAVLGGGSVLAVADANSDTVSFVDLPSKKVVTDLVVKPDPNLPFGSMPNALGLSEDGKTLYVANAGSNAVAAVNVENPQKPRVKGFIPTEWYPVAVVARQGRLFVANNKGTGSRSRTREAALGWNSYDYSASIERMDQPGERSLLSSSKVVRDLGRVPQILRANERTTTPGTAAVAIPKRLGEPSTIEHVVYVIKENRSYDQLFGDMPEGEGDPKLCVFPDKVTPNHHALAREFVLLDNYYCNGVLSADGHSWATEGNVTPYLDKAFGGFNRSYTFGDDPLTYSSTGFLWDRVLAAGLSFRNYGEMDYAGTPEGMGFKDVFAKYAAKEPITFQQNIGVERLRRYSCREYPGWNLAIPDQLRIDRFLTEFRAFEKNGDFPSLTIVYLPQDHTGGGATTRAHLADNDLAVGRLVEAISKSKFWAKTAIFINEDDPQGGFDHVDGHRSVCLVASPYTRRGAVVHQFYNQTSVLHTMLQILGLPPMNQQDAASNIMFECFTDKADERPYTAKPANIPLDELAKASTELTGEAKHWASIREHLPLWRTGLKTATDDENMTRMIWFDMKGPGVPFPSQFLGPHGKGLAKLGLKHVAVADDDDD